MATTYNRRHNFKWWFETHLPKRGITEFSKAYNPHTCQVCNTSVDWIASHTEHKTTLKSC